MRKPTKTLEEMLRAIIEAQKANGYAYFWCEDDGSGMSHDGTHWCGFSVLEILLDTDGLKAAYGEELTFKLDVSHKPAGQTAEVSFRDELPRWRFVAASIANTWHSGDGNNIQAAIETAYKLLPPKV